MPHLCAYVCGVLCVQSRPGVQQIIMPRVIQKTQRSSHIHVFDLVCVLDLLRLRDLLLVTW